MKILRDYEMLKKLESACDRYRSDSDAARAFGVSRGHLCHVLKGRKPISKALAHALGYELQACYVPYEYRT